jgi:hypothetical protein
MNSQMTERTLACGCCLLLPAALLVRSDASANRAHALIEETAAGENLHQVFVFIKSLYF